MDFIFITMTYSYYDDPIDVGYFTKYEDAVLSVQKSFYQPRLKWGDYMYYTDLKWIRTVHLSTNTWSDKLIEITSYSGD